MHIQPILAALRRNKSGAILIGLQIALTLAIVCNALFIIQQRQSYLSRSTGIVEDQLFTFQNKWIGDGESDLESLSAADLETVRSTPGVIDAYRSNSFPLRGGGWGTGVLLAPNDAKEKAHTAVYMVDDHALATLGVRLVAGRNFTTADLLDFHALQRLEAPVSIVSQSLADKLFPDGNALGKAIYLDQRSPPTTIVGIVQALQTPWVGNHWSDDFSQNSVLVPYRLMERTSNFVVRTRAGQVSQVMNTVRERLYAANRLRVIDKLRSFAEVRAHSYRAAHGMAILMSIVCAALLMVTAAGIVGLASFWVGQRQRQIGIRRALGATSTDILRYFQLENFLIGGFGSLLGTLVAIGINLWLVTSFEMPRLPAYLVAAAALCVLALGQLAVLQPALRASRVPPVTATR